MPLGICTVASRASRPSTAPPLTGMPTTGSTVFAAMLPARWAAIPAAAMITPKPFSAARFANSAAAAGVRWALITRTSNGISQLLSCAAAAFTVGQSLSEPMMMATFLVFSINPSPFRQVSLKRKRPWCSYTMALCLQFQRYPFRPQARRKTRGIPQTHCPGGKAGGLHPPRVRSGSQSVIDCIPVPPLNSLFKK